jgi:uncharacterized protein (DUF2336 family)
MSDMGRLAHLAANPHSGASREEIYLAIASLYRVQGAGLNGRERELMRDILRRLTQDVEMAIRIALAERLADEVNTPHDLILMLVDDKIEVARPLILRSPLLTDTDMLHLIAQYGVAHQEAIAQRPHIAEPVTDALVACNAETVLGALVRNATARISESGYATLVEKSRAFTSLQEPLAQRSDLPPACATRMCEWVSDALKTFITNNYAVSAASIEKAINHAETQVKSEARPVQPSSTDSAAKLVEKLASSGQLKAGFLMRVLHQGQMELFDLALARLLDMPVQRLRGVFYSDGPKNVALCCRAVGIDRSVFATVYNLSRQAKNMHALLTRTDMTEVETLFVKFTRLQAQQELQALDLA